MKPSSLTLNLRSGSWRPCTCSGTPLPLDSVRKVRPVLQLEVMRFAKIAREPVSRRFVLMKGLGLGRLLSSILRWRKMADSAAFSTTKWLDLALNGRRRKDEEGSNRIRAGSSCSSFGPETIVRQREKLFARNQPAFAEATTWRSPAAQCRSSAGTPPSGRSDHSRGPRRRRQS